MDTNIITLNNVSCAFFLIEQGKLTNNQLSHNLQCQYWYKKHSISMFFKPQTTSSESLTSAATASTPAVHQLQQFGVDGLPGLLQHPDELPGLPNVAGGEEGVGRALVGAAGRAANAVDVVLRRVGVVVVNDELDVLHVWAAVGSGGSGEKGGGILAGRVRGRGGETET